ncbi:MAG TPA: HNH endonuclease signature motif containing protein [Spirillospora sp.]|nr:HNH endonuclease signature motif containing protein [Spirillospora sp.]
MKRTPLERRTPLRNRKPLRRSTPPASPRPEPGGEGWAEWEALRAAVHTRSGGRCEAGVVDKCRDRRGDFARLGGHQAHHRKLRSRGGPDEVANLVAVCGYCHDWIHRHPRKATELGLIVPSWADPEVRGLIRPDGSVVLLDTDGGYVPVMDAPQVSA